MPYVITIHRTIKEESYPQSVRSMKCYEQTLEELDLCKFAEMLERMQRKAEKHKVAK